MSKAIAAGGRSGPGAGRVTRNGAALAPTTLAPTTLAMALVMALSACGGGRAPAPAPCPTTLFLKGAERTAAYRPGPSPGPEDLEHLAVLTDLVTVCRYGEEGVDVALRFNLIAEKGPAYGGGPLEFTYFVASLGPERQILSKPLLDVVIEFPEDQPRAGSTQQMTVHMPGVAPETGAQYSIYLGFQLDEAEMRRRLERRE